MTSYRVGTEAVAPCAHTRSFPHDSPKTKRNAAAPALRIFLPTRCITTPKGRAHGMTAKRRGQAAHFERTSGIRFSKASFSEPSVGNGMETLCLPAHHQFGSTET